MAQLVIDVSDNNSISTADDKLQLLTKTGKKTEKQIKNIGDESVESFGASAKSVATMAAKTIVAYGVISKLSQVVKSSVVTQSRFEQSMADLSAITGATGDDLKYLSDQAKIMGETTQYTASQAADAFKLVASAKPDLLENASAMSEVTKQVLILAQAAGSDLTESAETVGSALNQFGANADEAARFVNVLAAGSKYGASEVNDTSIALKNAGVSAASAGVSFEETNAAIQVLATNAIKGGEAGTALRNIILKLETSTDKKLKPSINGLSGALKNLNDTQPTSTSLVNLFGLENVNAATAILKNVENLNEMTVKLTGTNTAMEQASVRTNTLEGDYKKLQSSIEGTQITIGEKMNPAMRFLSQYTTEASDRLNYLLKAMNEGSKEQLSERLVELHKEIFQLDKDISDNETAFGRLGNVLSFTSTDSDYLKKKVAALREEYAAIQKQIESLNKTQKESSETTTTTTTTTTPTTNIEEELTKKQKDQIAKRIENLKESLMTQEELAASSLDKRLALIDKSELSEKEKSDLTLDVWVDYYDKLDSLHTERNNNLDSEAQSLRNSLANKRELLDEDYAKNKELLDREVIDASERTELKKQLDKNYSEEKQKLNEEAYKNASYFNNLTISALDDVSNAAGSLASDLITGTGTMEDAFKSLSLTIIDEVVGSLVKAGIQQVKNMIIGETVTKAQEANIATLTATQSAATAATTAEQVASASTVTAAAAPAAAATSVYSWGTAAAIGGAAFLASMALANQFRAQGGSVSSGSAYVVGERGREVFVPETNGSIISNSDLTSGSGTNLNVNVYNQSGSNVTTKQNASGGVDIYVTKEQLPSLMTNIQADRDSTFTRTQKSMRQQGLI